MAGGGKSAAVGVKGVASCTREGGIGRVRGIGPGTAFPTIGDTLGAIGASPTAETTGWQLLAFDNSVFYPNGHLFISYYTFTIPFEFY